MIKDSIKRVENWLFPGHCILCRKPTGTNGDICSPCRKSLPLNHHHCDICAQPLPDSVQAGSRCGNCQKTQPFYDFCISPFRYEEAVSELHRRFKFHKDLAAGRVLGELLADTLEQRCSHFPELIIPAPLGKKRLTKRGFNQAMELIRPASRRLAIPVSPTLIRRSRETPPQSDLPKKARHKNIRGAFSLNGKITAEHVAIVDDVMTTGFTVNEIARLLRLAGVKQVEVWVAARTP